jgi:hypothetical protein
MLYLQLSGSDAVEETGWLVPFVTVIGLHVFLQSDWAVDPADEEYPELHAVHVFCVL